MTLIIHRLNADGEKPVIPLNEHSKNSTASLLCGNDDSEEITRPAMIALLHEPFSMHFSNSYFRGKLMKVCYNLFTRHSENNIPSLLEHCFCAFRMEHFILLYCAFEAVLTPSN